MAEEVAAASAFAWSKYATKHNAQVAELVEAQLKRPKPKAPPDPEYVAIELNYPDEDRCWAIKKLECPICKWPESELVRVVNRHPDSFTPRTEYFMRCGARTPTPIYDAIARGTIPGSYCGFHGPRCRTSKEATQHWKCLGALSQ